MNWPQQLAQRLTSNRHCSTSCCHAHELIVTGRTGPRSQHVRGCNYQQCLRHTFLQLQCFRQAPGSNLVHSKCARSQLQALASAAAIDDQNASTGSSSSSDSNGVLLAELADRDTTDFIAETRLPTRSGKFRVRAYRHSIDGRLTYSEPSCIMTGQPEGQEEVPVRVHDACFTSEVLGSLKCDCAEQLRLSMRYIQEHGCGMIIYLQQEGRGIGLANKIAAYALQEEGLDTVDANRALGLPDDCREYTSVRNILRDMGVRSIRLMTNNPRKISMLRELGVTVTERIPCIVKAQEYSEGYLNTKQARMDHQLDGSSCFWNHGGDSPALLPSPASPLLQRLQDSQQQQQAARLQASLPTVQQQQRQPQQQQDSTQTSRQ